MNGVKKIVKKIIKNSFLRSWYVFLMTCRDSNISIFDFFFAKEKNYVFMIAMHNNAGDLAQTVCIDEWIRQNYFGIVINVAWTAPEWESDLKKICGNIKENDRIFIQSGYNITDIADEFAAPTVFSSHRIILESLPNHRIVFFPQSVAYKSLEKWKEIEKMYSKHCQVVFLSRDKVSFEYARALLPRARHLCYPDIVTSWIGTFTFSKPSSDILLCLRTGPESMISEVSRNELLRRLNGIGMADTTDTDVDCGAFYYRKHRKKAVLEKIRQFSEYKVIVTDRFHGVIFSLIASRPVVVLKTAGHKVKAMLDWFPESFKEYVYFIENPNDIDAVCYVTAKLVHRKTEALSNTYFQDEFYKKLKDEMELV